MNLIDYGFIPLLEENIEEIPARITATYRDRYEFVCENGTGLAKLKKGNYYEGDEDFPTTGDFVMLKYEPNGESIITKTLERKTYFSRRDPSYSGNREQAIAANFDYVFIMQSLNRDFNIHRIERYLTLAWQSGAIPVVILTKADLVDDFSEQVRAIEKIAIGVCVFAISSVSGYGLDELRAFLKPRKTIVFLGSSGIGKSTLVNALAGKDIMAVNIVREDDSRGRHTTTHRQLIMLPSGVMVIDTPGMRELGMWDITEGLGQSYTDIEKFFGKCKFSDCHHESEPGCAIQEAIANGEMSKERWQSYLKLKNEAKYSDDKEDFLKAKRERFKGYSKLQKEMKKTGHMKK